MLIPRQIPEVFRASRQLTKSQRRHDIDVVLSAFRSFRSIYPVGYLSTPITTGILFYQVLEKYQVKTLVELLARDRSLLFEEIIKPNTDSGIALGDELAKKWKLPIIVPAVFEAKSQRWTQDDYMYVWYQVIREMIGHTILRDGWEYSNGGAEEFVHSVAMQFRLLSASSADEKFPIYIPVDLFPNLFIGPKIEFPEKTMKITNERGRDVRVEEGVIKISQAIDDLYHRGFRATKLLALLMQLVGMTYCVNSHLKNKEYQNHGLAPAYEIDQLLVDHYWQLALVSSQESFREIKSFCYN